MEEIHLSWNSHQFARAANPDGLNTEIYVLTVLEAEGQDPGAHQMVSGEQGLASLSQMAIICLCPHLVDRGRDHLSPHGLFEGH